MMSYLWLKTFIITLEHALRHGRCSSLGYFDGNIMEISWIPSWICQGASNQLEIFTMPLQLSSTLQNSSKSSSCVAAQPRRQPNTLMGPIKPALTATSCMELPKNWWYPPTHVIELSGKLCISTHQIYGFFQGNFRPILHILLLVNSVNSIFR